MNYQKYEISQNEDSTIFEFVSIGANGSIIKAIKFTKTNNQFIYNLGFGNKIQSSETNKFRIDDLAISNNGDRDVILATIANAVFVFTRKYPEMYVYFKGTSSSRTRLYRMVISNNFKELSAVFSIFGIITNSIGKEIVVAFDVDIDFIGFLIKRK